MLYVTGRPRDEQCLLLFYIFCPLKYRITMLLFVRPVALYGSFKESCVKFLDRRQKHHFICEWYTVLYHAKFGYVLA